MKGEPAKEDRVEATQSILLFPSIRRGNGTGHLIRCCRTASLLGVRAEILLRERIETISFEAIVHQFPDLRFVTEISDENSTVVVDQRAGRPELVDPVRQGRCMIALDDDGPLRRTSEYTVDMLRTTKRGGAANFRVIPPSPSNSRSIPLTRVEKVLVTFGGEDPANLSTIALHALHSCPDLDRATISVVPGPASAFEPTPWLDRGVRLIEPSPDLRERFAEYDLILTSYGLTAHEALAAGCAVGAVDPTRYHSRQSGRAGFYRLGVRSVSIRRLRRLVRRPSRSARLAQESASPLDLVDLLRRYRFVARNRCPICGKEGNRSVARLASATFFMCDCSGLLYRIGFEATTQQYGVDYFLSSYRQQYGRSYLEDFDTIKTVGEARLDVVDTLLRRMSEEAETRPRLLDVGCAFGPFVSAATDRGYRCLGIDVSLEAVTYVRQKLGIEAIRVDALEFRPDKARVETFDVITLWYVIEHFERLGDLLEHIRSWITPGGLLAFSTPNLRGVSGLVRPMSFLSASPADHFVIFSRRSARRVLNRYGFRVVRSRTTGHHPERFPIVGRFRVLRPIVRAFSRVVGLGDTFEVYARAAEVTPTTGSAARVK